MKYKRLEKQDFFSVSPENLKMAILESKIKKNKRTLFDLVREDILKIMISHSLAYEAMFVTERKDFTYVSKYCSALEKLRKKIISWSDTQMSIFIEEFATTPSSRKVELSLELKRYRKFIAQILLEIKMQKKNLDRNKIDVS